MNDFTIEEPKTIHGNVHIPQPKFTERGEWDNCTLKSESHDWAIIAYYENSNPGAGLSICKKCTELKTGWVTYE